jgi:hypothetical protein
LASNNTQGGVDTTHLRDLQWLIYTYESKLAGIGGLFDRDQCEFLCNDLDQIDTTWGHWARLVLHVPMPP